MKAENLLNFDFETSVYLGFVRLSTLPCRNEHVVDGECSWVFFVKSTIAQLRTYQEITSNGGLGW